VIARGKMLCGITASPTASGIWLVADIDRVSIGIAITEESREMAPKVYVE